MEKRPRDKSRKHEIIVAAATAVFGEEGFDAASMDRVAERAEVSKRTIYNHFPTKTDLFKAVVEIFVTKMSDLKKIVYDPTRSIADQLGDFAEAELALALNPDWLRFTKVLLVAMIREPLLAADLLQNYRGGADTLVAWIEAATEHKRLQVENPKGAAAVFSAMIAGAFTWPAIYMGHIDPLASQSLKQEIVATFLARYEIR